MNPPAARPPERRPRYALDVTPEEALAFVRAHGVVLESAAGPVPSLAAEIAGESVRGTWWSHPRSHEIFRVTRAVRDSPDVLVCRLVAGKITFVHRRLWRALVAAAASFEPARLARVREVHTQSGRHVTQETTFPEWVPPAVLREASVLPREEALAALGEWSRA